MTPAADARPAGRTSLRRALTAMIGSVPALVVALALAPAAAAQNGIPAAGPECDEAELGSDELILVFSETAVFRHASIEDGVAAVCEVVGGEGIAADHTEDSSNFTAAQLDDYDAVVFLSTTGDVLSAAEQDAFEAYIQAGGGYAGIHAASDTEYDWPWYGELVGAYFQSHPQNQTATIKVSDSEHPSTAGLPQRWERFDEWYNFQSNPRGDVHVLATLDESSYTPGSGAMGADHPTAWCHPFDGGRSWYTGGGHTSESYSEPLFRDHILGGIMWAAGFVEGECGGTIWDNFQRTTLAIGQAEAGEPIGLTVLPDRSVLHTSRDGTLFHSDADGNTHVAAEIPVYSYEEDGLQALTLDPDFEQNNWVYVFYSPELDTPPGEAPHDGQPADWEPYEGVNYLSRFKWDPAAEELDLGSEQVLLEVDQDRGMCCHLGGDFAWDPAGNLYLSTGDDTDPFESSGYTPIDERPTRNPAYDAQRTSANTNDLRGKILRINPDPEDPTYTIPSGNLFAPGTPGTRPEIYAMGFRNPFRIGLDPATGHLYVGDYGPDAGAPNPTRGPGGQVEFNVIREAGFYGWPYCTGDNDAYIDYDFATGTSGEPFDCDAPVNDSPRNTGLTALPPAIQPDIWYGNGGPWEAEMFPGGSESPMAGPVYRFDPDNPSTTKLPAYYDGHWFLYEWGRGWIKETAVDALGGPLEVSDFLNTPAFDLTRPMDMEIGPDGALYVLDYGSGFFNGAPDSAVYRFDYVEGAPQVSISADPTEGDIPLEVTFTSVASDPDGGALEYSWDFGDGGTSNEPNPIHTYTEVGTYEATLTVTDEDGKTASDSVEITATDCGPGPIEPDDQFDGDSLDECRWSEIVRPVPNQLSVGGGELAIDTGNGTDMFGGTTTAENLVLQPAPDAPWEITTEMTMPFTGKTYEQAALFVYGSDANWAKLSLILTPDGRRFEFTLQSGGQAIFDPAQDYSPILGPEFPDTAFVRIRNDGSTLTAFYSEDGEEWNEFGRARPVSGIPDPKVGVGAFNGDGSGNEATFNFFDLEPIDVEPTECDDPVSPDPGYELLFDGTEASFNQWQMAGPGGFNLTTECTLESFGGLGLLHREEVYDSPVTFRIEWMMPGDDNSGVFVGNWDAGPNAHNQSISEGYEIQIDATDSPQATTGAIYSFQAADQELRDEALNPPGQWNTYEITVDDPNIVVRLNGATINEFTSTDPARDLSQSRLGIQNHGVGDEVYFRRIQVKEHAAPPFEPPSCDQPGSAVDPDDEFDGSELDGCRWNRVVRPDDAARAVEDGSLHLETSYADIYAANNTPVTNMILQDTPNGDWVAETKVSVPLEICCQQAGLIAYLDDGNYVKWDAIADPGMNQARLELRSEIDDVVQQPEENVWVDYPGDDTYWLRLAKEGDTYSSAYSLDGESWTDFPVTVDNEAISDGAAIGPFVLGIFQNDPIWAAFDWFTLSGDAVNSPPVIESIAADPVTGEAPLEVDFTAEASDPDEDELSFEWDFGDGSTSNQQNPTHTYAEPGTYEAELTVSDGAATASDSVTITVEPGEVGEPAINLRARPPIRRIGPKKKQVSYRALARNVGTAPTGAFRLCAKAPKKRVKVVGASCRPVSGLAPNASAQRAFKFKVKRKARGKTTRIRFIARGPGFPNQTTAVRLQVRR
ncbi:MAG TPA: ThuA domain-containing protein [Solirubrobacterales bacterium]|nr:ThuA domain-containing protein [Solirubrobacterales bacterium]